MFLKAKFLKCLWLLLIPGFASYAGFAQSASGTLEGNIVDATGAVIPGAHVKVVAQATGVSRDVVSNQAGFYSVTNLSPGRYDVTVTASGFGSHVQKDLVLNVGAVRDLDTSLTVSASDVSINVESTVNGVNPVDTSIQGVVDGKQTRDLPLNGRDWTSLATLNTGVSQILTQYPGAATATTRLSRGLGAQLTIGGNRPQQNSYRLDGVNINDYANGGPGSVTGYTLGVDSVQEFTVITSDAPAQYGRMSGGVVNSVSRSGTNDFHGSAYDYLRNSVFDARNYFTSPGAPNSLRRNQFGGTLGGPILHDRTFFFFNYEGFRQAQAVPIVSVVLSPNARKGLVTCTQAAAGATQNKSCLTSAGGVVAPAGAAGVTQLTVDPAVPPFLALYPLPNGAINGNSGLYNFTTTQKTNEDFMMLHMDHNFSQKDSLHGTLLYDTASVDSADQTNTLYDEAISRRTTAAVEEIHIFSSTLSNSFRLGYNRSVAIAPNQKAVINTAADDPALAYYAGRTTGQLIVSGLTTVQGGSGAVGTNAYHFNSYQIQNDTTYVHGKQSITMGLAIEHDQNNALGGILPNGEWNFGSVNGLLTNAPTFFEGGVPGTPVVPHDLRQTIYAGYVQDSWRGLKNVTVNAGVRYEMATNSTESRGRLGALLTPTSPAAVYVNSFFDSNPTLKNFEPRLGIAWDVYGNGNTILSAASGIYDTLPLNYALAIQANSSAPSYEEGRVTGVAKGSFPISPFYTITPKLRVIYTPRNPPRSYVIQSNANLQQQISKNTVFQIGYIGSHGVHQVFNTNDINNVPPLGRDPNGNYYFPDVTKVSGAARAALMLNPNVGTESYTAYVGSSLYNSMQTSLSYNAPRGIVGKIAYTWSHSIDDSSSQISGASFSNALSGLPYFDLRLGRGNSDFDIRHVFSANAVAPLPDLKRGGRYTAPLRGWTLNNIFTMRSGIPFTPIVGGDPLGELGSQTFDFPDRIVTNSSCTRPHNLNYLDTSCFAFPTTYSYAPGFNGPRFGTSRRNTIQGPGLFLWTTGIMKDQVITERVRVQLQAQAFNVTNHTNFANPASAQTQIFNATGALSSTAGLLTTTAADNRQLQFSVKLQF